MKKIVVLTLCLALLVQACNLTAFGETLNHTGSTVNPYQYTGQQLDSSMGLYDLRSRYYDPAIGRFLSQDIYPYNLGDPAQLNRYTYTANNPVNFIDPLGLQAFTEYGMLQQKNEKQAEAESGAYSSKGSSFIDDAGGNTCFNSFSADTEVATEDGEKAISEIKIGDFVLAWNWETGEISFYPVTDTIHHTDKTIVYLTIDDETLTTTLEHPFYVEGKGWVEAKDLQVGDDLRKADGSTGKVKSVKTEKTAQEMYNLTVDEAHTFYVGEGQWLVHNECLPDVVRYPIEESPTGPLSGARQTAINRAWAQEKMLIEQTGKGSQTWTDAELKEILQSGRLSNYTGHHINNAASFPEWQGDPRNITFLQNGSGGGTNLHLLEGHGGAWGYSSGLLIDRALTVLVRFGLTP